MIEIRTWKRYEASDEQKAVEELKIIKAELEARIRVLEDQSARAQSKREKAGGK